jgi:hypothetical protein
MNALEESGIMKPGLKGTKPKDMCNNNKDKCPKNEADNP